MKIKPTLILAGIAILAIAGIAKLAMAGAPNEDWGDAPDPTYPTLAASAGANHTAIGPILGTERDIESDGQPNTPATGDDMSLLPDDEDGVLLTSAMIPGGTGTVTVTTSGTGPYILNAWIDFNDDGDWADGGEQIFTDEPLVLGPNALTFPVPPGAMVKSGLYSRWRLNTTGGLSYTGPAADGEVEDYCHSSIHGQKWHDLNGNGKREDNEPGLNGQIIDLIALGDLGDPSDDKLVASATTQDMETDMIPGIDPIRERGVYWLPALPGYHIVRERPNPAFDQTFPANCGAKEYFIFVQCEPLGRTPEPPVCGNEPNWVELCPPGLDEMFSAAQLLLQTPPGPPFNGEILTIFASGPTFVNRSVPMTPGVGSAFIQTEMVQMDLIGIHPLTGPIHIQAGSGIPFAPPMPPSQGQIFELPTGDDFTVESFFDVFFEIQIPGAPDPLFQQMRGEAQVQAIGGITQVPPIGSEYVEENVPLTSAPFGPGDLNEFEIIRLVHKPIFGFDFGNMIKPTPMITEDPAKTVQKTIITKKIRKLKKKIKKARKRKQSAKAKRLAKKLRRLQRQLRALG